jgi:beta-ribofuranosylaminobenzene 5'-phosphate synthase
MIRIRTASRLHFGLFSLPFAQAEAWPNQEGQATIPRREFGGVGLMIDKPGVELTADEAKRWSAEGPQADRTLRFAQAYCVSMSIQEVFHLRVVAAAHEHVGLGTGTQLGLAVARALAGLTGQVGPALDVANLAKRVGRGLRSAIGVHGFQHGGFLVEAGKTSDETLSPLLLHNDFPVDWSVLLIIPHGLQGTHGRREIDAFGELANHEPNERATEALCRIVLLGMLPAFAQRDLPAFGEALYEFNRRVGAMFQSAQGGLYAHPRVEQIVDSLRDLGIKGVGQSSWGPAIFAVTHGHHANEVRDLLVRKQIITPDESLVAFPWNYGPEVRGT